MSSRFPSLRLEGGLISSDQIDRIADQKAKEFSIDDIASAWSEVQSYWTIFQNHLGRLPENDPAISITRKWMIQFFSTLGYELSAKNAAEVDGLTYAISHRARSNDDSTPVHIVGFNQSLDRRPESGRPRLAPHSLVQEYLNRTEYLWGIITNGKTLRILRDSNLLRKQAYIEFDLEQIVRGEQFADFALLYRLIHISRLPTGIDDVNSCALELFHKQTIEQGGRVRDHLRDRVKEALEQFGKGFLSHPKNTVLREKVQDKSLEAFEYYQQLLRLIYRFLFLMVSEERNLITDNMQYREHYSISRIRRLAEVRAAYTGQEDLWLGLATTFKLFQDEELGPLVGVPTLNGDLFDPTRTSEINEASLSNRDLLTAMWDICMYREKENVPWRRINYAALDVEELGSVYESLLDFQPVFFEQNGKTEFKLLTGTERKSTGSYYTPPELVNELILSALIPVIKGRLVLAKTPTEKENALLALTVCDPACGSGHFLLAAARTIGRELAKARTGDEEPAPEQMRIAIRDSITHCIYGVDKNPLAVDLCKVALWLEGHTIHKPLTFLDHRVRCGDSLVGVFDLKVIEEGIPDDAYMAVQGDEKSVVKEIKQINKSCIERERQNRNLSEFDPAVKTLTESRELVNSINDDVPENVRKKREIFSRIQKEGTPWCKDKTVCDIWTSAFFAELSQQNQLDRKIPTTETIRLYVNGALNSSAPVIQYSRYLSKQNHFFHWHLEFPEVFSKGGFDCILGNPPWEKVKLQEKDWFAGKNQEISESSSKNSRKTLIDNLKSTNPVLYKKWIQAQITSEKVSYFINKSKFFTLTGFGDINTYPVFTELCGKNILKSDGIAGIIVKTGIATDYYAQYLFAYLIENNSVKSLFDFVNSEGIFPDVARPERFCLFTLSGKNRKNAQSVFSFNSTNFDNFRDKSRQYSLSKEQLLLLNPNTKTCPVFKTKKDCDLTVSIFERFSILNNKSEAGNLWGVNFHRIYDMSNDSNLFEENKKENLENQGYVLSPSSIFTSETEVFLPFYEAKNFNLYDHRFGTFEGIPIKDRFITRAQPKAPTPNQKNDNKYEIMPRYWMNINDFKKSFTLSWDKNWIFAFRKITRETSDTRSTMGTFLPMYPISDSAIVATFEGENPAKKALVFSTIFLSFTFDYLIRQKLSGTNLSFFILEQIAIPTPESVKKMTITVSNETSELFEFLLVRAAKLMITSHSLDGLIKDLEINDAPYSWNDEERKKMTCEIDAAVAHLYNLSREDYSFILDFFRIQRNKDIKQYGEFRTKILCLGIFDKISLREKRAEAK